MSSPVPAKVVAMNASPFPFESASLSELEIRVERGLQAFAEVGLALMAIRDRRLYVDAGFSSFASYLRERWNLSRPYGYQLIDAARVARELSACADIPPPGNEAQARELAPLLRKYPDEVVPLWRAVVEQYGRAVSGRQVKQEVSRRMTHLDLMARPQPESNSAAPPKPERPAPSERDILADRLARFRDNWRTLAGELAPCLEDVMEPGAVAYATAGLGERLWALIGEIEDHFLDFFVFAGEAHEAQKEMEETESDG